MHPKYKVPWNAQHVVLAVTVTADVVWARWLGVYLSYDWWGSTVVFFAMISNIFVNVGCIAYFFPVPTGGFPLGLARPDTRTWHWHQRPSPVLFLRARFVARGLAEGPECHAILRLCAGRLDPLYGSAPPVEARCVSTCRNLRNRIKLEVLAWLAAALSAMHPGSLCECFGPW